MKSRALFFTGSLLLWVLAGCTGDASDPAPDLASETQPLEVPVGVPSECNPDLEYCPDEPGDPNLEPIPAEPDAEECTTTIDESGNEVTICQPAALCHCECRPAPNGVGRRLYWNNTCTQNSWPYQMPASGRCADINLTQCRSVQSGNTTYDLYGSSCATSVAGVNRFCQ